jgi:hypothetical protein
MPRKKSFIQKIWSGDGAVEDYLVHLVSDGIKTLSLLAVLWIVWEFISLMRFRHFPEPYLDALEKVHFAGTVSVLTVTSFALVLSQVIELWKKSKEI